MAARRRSTRLAAWLTLACAVVLALSIAALIVRSALAVTAALLALALATFAGWRAVSRRGGARVAWVACATLAVALGVLALVAGGAVRELVAIGASLALVTLALRTTFDEPARPASTAARKERKVLLVNPRAGDGRPVQAGLVDEAIRRGIEPVVLDPGDDLRTVAEEALLRADVMGMAGGDGSQALVADIARAHEIPFVCVPAGTRNHFALDLGLDRNDMIAALDAFESGGHMERHVDLGRVNGRAFVNNVSLGLYAEIVKDRAYRPAKLATAARLLPDLLGEEGPMTHVTFAGPDGELHEGSRLLLVSNNPYVLARMVGFGARPRLDSGRLGIVAIDVAGAEDAAALVSLQAVGAVSRFEGWKEWTAEAFTVGATGPVAAGIDGEAVELEPPLVFTVEPGALRVRLSPAADRRRARRAKEHGGPAEVLENLWAIATGQVAGCSGSCL